MLKNDRKFGRWWNLIFERLRRSLFKNILLTTNSEIFLGKKETKVTFKYIL